MLSCVKRVPLEEVRPRSAPRGTSRTPCARARGPSGRSCPPLRCMNGKSSAHHASPHHRHVDQLALQEELQHRMRRLKHLLQHQDVDPALVVARHEVPALRVEALVALHVPAHVADHADPPVVDRDPLGGDRVQPRGRSRGRTAVNGSSSLAERERDHRETRIRTFSASVTDANTPLAVETIDMRAKLTESAPGQSSRRLNARQPRRGAGGLCTQWRARIETVPQTPRSSYTRARNSGARGDAPGNNKNRPRSAANFTAKGGH